MSARRMSQWSSAYLGCEFFLGNVDALLTSSLYPRIECGLAGFIQWPAQEWESARMMPVSFSC